MFIIVLNLIEVCLSLIFTLTHFIFLIYMFSSPWIVRVYTSRVCVPSLNSTPSNGLLLCTIYWLLIWLMNV